MEGRKGVRTQEAAKDENRVPFNSRQQPRFEQLRSALEDAMNKNP